MNSVMSQARILLSRLPKNLRSNRWWIFWNRKLYLHSKSIEQIGRESDSESAVAKATGARCHSYLHWRLLLPRSSPRDRSSDALFLPEMGMFGNMTRRLAAALAVGDALQIGHVVVPPTAEFQGDIFQKGKHRISQSQTLWLFAEEKSSNPVKVLHRIDFLVGPSLGESVLIPSIRKSWEALSSLMIPAPRGSALPADHLVFHIRGGDVFGPRRPSSYGQPPLAYYTAIIDSAPWSAVTIVSSDQLNPTVNPLVESCRSRGIPVELQSGSLTEDLGVLLTARTLVAGRGTFMPAVCGLSRVVQRVFYFHDKFSLYPPVPGLEIVRVSDLSGDYVRNVLSNNWSDSPAQREMMLEYSPKNLVIEQ